MGSMVGYSKAAMERAMKVQEVILRAMAKRITWWQAAGEDFSAAGSDGTGRAGAAVLSGEVLRSECAALSPETGGGARNQAELHLGQAGAAGSGTGGAGAQAGSASQAAPAPAAAGDAVAHRWQLASLVPGRALVRPAGDSRRCHQRDLLRAAGGRRIHADGDGGAEGSDRAAGRVLRLVKRPRQPFLAHSQGGRQSGPTSPDPSGACSAGVGNPDDSGVLATGARTERAQFPHLAGTASARTATTRGRDGGSREPVPARALRGRVQSQVSGQSPTTGQCFSKPREARSG